MTEQQRATMRDMLECHREYMLERAEQCPEIAKACRAVVERERSLFAWLWNEPSNLSLSARPLRRQ